MLTTSNPDYCNVFLCDVLPRFRFHTKKGTATGPLQSEFRDSATPSAPLVENWPATTGRTVGRSESGAGKPKLVKELEHHLRDEMRKTESAGEARSSDVGRLQVRHYPTGFFKK